MPSFEPSGRELESVLAVDGLLQLTKCALIINQRVAKVAALLFSLSAREIWILLAARSGKPVTQKQIAKHVGLNENSLVLLLDRLEERGHIRRVRNPENRREQFVRLTDKGKTVARRALAAEARVCRTVFAPLDDAFVQALIKAVQDVLAFEAAGGRAVRR